MIHDIYTKQNMLFFCSRAILLQTPLIHWEASGSYNKNISEIHLIWSQKQFLFSVILHYSTENLYLHS